jgi:adenine-specific DNA methylase
MSYNSEGIVSKDDIIELMKKTGWSNIIVYEKEYKRFKSNTLGDQSKSVIEYLFCATALDFVI